MNVCMDEWMNEWLLLAGSALSQLDQLLPAPPKAGPETYWTSNSKRITQVFYSLKLIGFFISS